MTRLFQFGYLTPHPHKTTRLKINGHFVQINILARIICVANTLSLVGCLLPAFLSMFSSLFLPTHLRTGKIIFLFEIILIGLADAAGENQGILRHPHFLK